MGKYCIWGLLKIKIWRESFVDNYQIVHHHNKVPLIPLVDYRLLVYVYIYSTLIYFLPKSTSFPPKTNRNAPLRPLEPHISHI